MTIVHVLRPKICRKLLNPERFNPSSSTARNTPHLEGIMALGPPRLIRFWGEWPIDWGAVKAGSYTYLSECGKDITDVTMAQGWCCMTDSQSWAYVPLGPAWLPGAWDWDSVREPGSKAASTSLPRYQDRRSLSQVRNQAISEIGAELYSAKTQTKR